MTNTRIQTFIKTIKNPVAIAASGLWNVQHNGRKLSEGLPAHIVPVLAVSVLNKSSNDIEVFINEAADNSFGLSANSSRALEGVPAWDVSVRNMDAVEIAKDEISITLINDLEQTSRYNSSVKSQRGY